MGRNLPPIRSHDNPPWREKPRDDAYADSRRGPTTECAVCGKPLRKRFKPFQRQFCEAHDVYDLREKERGIEEHMSDSERYPPKPEEF